MEAPYSEILGQLVADTFKFTDKYNVAVKQKANFIENENLRFFIKSKISHFEMFQDFWVSFH